MGKYSDKSLKVSRKYLLHAKFEVAERIWFYLIPTIKCTKENKYYEIEFDFLTFYLYAVFSKHEDDL